jgi:hypothetical protein
MLSDQPPCKEDIVRLEVIIAPRGKAARAMVINTSLPDPTDTVAPLVTRLAEEAVTRNQRASGARKATPMDGRKLDKLYADMFVPQAEGTVDMTGARMDIDDADAEILRDALMDSTGRVVEWDELEFAVFGTGHELFVYLWVGIVSICFALGAAQVVP